MIKVGNLTKNYGQITAVDNISFEIEKGKIVGFLGPNGAGKTTTMKILTGYIPPTSGTVEIAGIDVLENSLEARKKIGYLPETTPLYKNMQVVEYLNFVCESREIDKSLRKERIQYVMEKLGLKTMGYKMIKSLSKGYKQRVGLAQALIHKPEILILDEPTSGLDPNQVIEIRELIKEIGKDKTVIFSSHILQEVEAVSDDILIINKGSIVASGTKEELSKSSNDITEVLFKGEKENIVNMIESIEGVLNYKEITSLGENEHKFEIESQEDIREILFNKAVENSFIILEMKKQSVNLEEIFKKLTV